MTPTLRAATVIVLFGASLSAVVGAAVCFFRAERSPRSEIARRLIEHERALEDPFHYSPATELLDEQGKELRRRGRKLAWIAGLLLFALFAFASVVS